MKNKSNPCSVEEFKIAIQDGRTETVCRMIRAYVLEDLDRSEVEEIFHSLILLRNQEVIHLLAARAHYFPIEMLDVEIKNHNDKDFISFVLEKYGKKFHYKETAVANRLFEVACVAECKPFLLFLLKKGLAEGQYPRLISGSDTLLTVLNEIKVSALHPDTVVTFFMEAAVSENSEARIRELIRLGFPISTVNSEGLNACEALRRGIESYHYGKDKQSQIEKQRDLQGLKTLERICNHPENQL